MKTLNLACCAGIGLIGSLVFLHWKDPHYKKQDEVTVPTKLPQETVATLIKPAGSVIQPLSISKKPIKNHVREVRTSRTSGGILQPSVIRFKNLSDRQRPGTQSLIDKIDENGSMSLAVNAALYTTAYADAIAGGPNTQEQEPAAVELNSSAAFNTATTPPAAEPPAVEVSHAVLHTDASATNEPVYKTVAAIEKPVAKNKAVYIPSYVATTRAETGTESYSYMMLYQKAEQLKTYAEKNGYDTEYAFFVNLGMKSGKKRFFVFDLTSMTIVKSGLVAHGRGNSKFTFDKTYSNKPGSNCSSLGMFKVGKFYNGSFGPSYKLSGLENTNSHAYDRSIVLHAMNCMPYDESDYPVCQSEGCPSLSSQFFKEIRPFIDERDKPMLLWVYDPATENQ